MQMQLCLEARRTQYILGRPVRVVVLKKSHMSVMDNTECVSSHQHRIRRHTRHRFRQQCRRPIRHQIRRSARLSTRRRNLHPVRHQIHQGTQRQCQLPFAEQGLQVSHARSALQAHTRRAIALIAVNYAQRALTHQFLERHNVSQLL